MTMASSTAGAVLCYTSDGSTTPQCNAAKDGCEAGSTPAAVNLSATTTLKAMACKSGMDDSTVASATYTKDTTAPTLSSTNPGVDETNVDPASGTITLVFNENMKTSQTTHGLTTLACGDSSDTSLGDCGSSLYWQTVPNTGTTFTWENATTLKVQFSWVRFPENSQIQWTLAKDNIKDRAGNVLAADITRTFTTRALNSRGNGAIADTGQTSCYYYQCTQFSPAG